MWRHVQLDPRAQAPPAPVRAIRSHDAHSAKNETSGRRGLAPKARHCRARWAELAALVNWQICNVAAVESNAPAIRRDLSAQLADQRRFTGAVRANNRVQFTDWDCQRNAVGGDHSTETFGQHFDLQQSVSHGAPRQSSHQFRRALRSPRIAGTVRVSDSSIRLRVRAPPRGPKT